MSNTATALFAFVALLASSLWIAAEAGTNEAGLAFLAENKNKPGVVTLPSGLQYKVLTKGKGPAHPTVDSPCSCHYEGKLIDGTVFDSSYERGEPTTFAPNQVLKAKTMLDFGVECCECFRFAHSVLVSPYFTGYQGMD